MRTALALEFAVLYLALPATLVLGLPGFPVIPVLVIAALACGGWLLRRPGWSPARLFHWTWTPADRRRVLLRTALGGLALAGGVLVFAPELWLNFPRQHPGWWAAVIVLYPLLSVLPQGIVYRAFLCERYAPLFGQGLVLDLAATAAFACGHIVFRNPLAVVLTIIGGWVFFRAYRRTGCLMASNLEHAILGDLLFTLGYGAFFFHGAVRP